MYMNCNSQIEIKTQFGSSWDIIYLFQAEDVEWCIDSSFAHEEVVVYHRYMIFSELNVLDDNLLVADRNLKRPILPNCWSMRTAFDQVRRLLTSIYDAPNDMADSND